MLSTCQQATREDRHNDEAFISIFNGENLNGWNVDDNILAQMDSSVLFISNDSSGKRGFLLTQKEYQNFHLEFDFLCPPSSNSGFVIRHQSWAENPDSYNGYEINIFNVQDTQNPTGSIMNLSRSFLPDNFDPNSWNNMEIIAKGDYISVSINDTKVNEIHDRRSLKGKVGFITNGGKLKHLAMYKNIRIKEMSATEIWQPQIEDFMRYSEKHLPKKLFNGKDLSGWKIVGDGIWLVQDGYISGKTNHDDFSFLRSERTFKNFYLKLKFNIAKEHNSGVFIRQNPDSTNINLNTGLEINVYDHNGFSYGWPTGSVVTKARSFIGLVDYGEWNTMEIFAFNKHTCIYVNGMKATEYYMSDAFNQPGNICLQVGIKVALEQKGGSEVLFKDIVYVDFDIDDSIAF